MMKAPYNHHEITLNPSSAWWLDPFISSGWLPCWSRQAYSIGKSGNSKVDMADWVEQSPLQLKQDSERI